LYLQTSQSQSFKLKSLQKLTLGIKFIAGVVDTGSVQFITGDVGTGGKFIPGVNDTSKKDNERKFNVSISILIADVNDTGDKSSCLISTMLI